MSAVKPGTGLVAMTDAVDAMAIGLVARKNIVLKGPAGHAKSMLACQVIDYLGEQGATCHFETWSVDTSVVDTLGGLSPEHVQKYQFNRPAVERSWITKDIAVIEEGFDASPRVLASLKDLLISRRWRLGDEEVPMRTRSVVVLTNEEPERLSKISPSIAALMERFPVVANVVWPTYNSKAFGYMFKATAGQNGRVPQAFKTEIRFPGWDVISSEDTPETSAAVLSLLCEYLGLAVGLGATVSPRAAMYARDLMEANAKIEGRNTDEYDLLVLRLHSSVASYHDKVMERVQFATRVEADKDVLKELQALTAQEVAFIEGVPPLVPPKARAEAALRMAHLDASLEKVKGRKWQDTTRDEATRTINEAHMAIKRVSEVCHLEREEEAEE